MSNTNFNVENAIIPEIQIDFENVGQAYAMKDYIIEQLKVPSCIVTENPVILTVYNLPAGKLNSIKRTCAINKFTTGTLKVINTSKNAIIGAADIAAYQVVTPIAKASIAATTGIGKILAKSTLATGASLVRSTIENTRKTVSELKHDEEVIGATQELKSAYSYVKNFLGFGDDNNNNNVRIIVPEQAKPEEQKQQEVEEIDPSRVTVM